MISARIEKKAFFSPTFFTHGFNPPSPPLFGSLTKCVFFFSFLVLLLPVVMTICFSSDKVQREQASTQKKTKEKPNKQPLYCWKPPPFFFNFTPPWS